MSTPNIPSGFKPTPAPSKPVIRGQQTTSDANGNSYKEASNIFDTKGKKYNVKRFMYPYDLDSSPEYGRQTAVFFINVHSAGKSITGSEQTLYDIPDEDITKFGGTRLLEAAGSGANAVIKGVVGDNATSGQIEKALTASKMMRLDTAISLHMPNSVKTNYGVNWGEASDEEMRNKELVVQSLIKTSNAMKSNNGFVNKVTGAAGAAGDVAFTALGNLAVNAVGKYGQKAASITGGNSKAEQVFDGVQFREFEFSYQFFPKSPDEAENILNIIRLFRYHMLPEFLDTLSFMYIYPSEFNIKYYSNGKENQYLEKLSTCVLKSLDVDYTPNGQFSTFAPTDKGAMPTQINVSMTFQELSKPSKETSPWEGAGL